MVTDITNSLIKNPNTPKEFIPFGFESPSNTKGLLNELATESDLIGIVPFSLNEISSQNTNETAFVFTSLSISFEAWKTEAKIEDETNSLLNLTDLLDGNENDENDEMTNFDFSMTLVMMMPFQVDPEKVRDLSAQLGLLSKELISDIEESLEELDFDSELSLDEISEFANNISELKNEFENNVYELLQYAKDENAEEINVDESKLTTMTPEILKELKSFFQLAELLAEIKPNEYIESVSNSQSESKLESIKLKLFEYKELGLTKVSLDEKFESIGLKIKSFKENTFIAINEKPEVSNKPKELIAKLKEVITPNVSNGSGLLNPADKIINEVSAKVKNPDIETYKDISSEIRPFLIHENDEKTSDKEKVFIWKNGQRIEVKAEVVEDSGLNSNSNKEGGLKYEEQPTNKKTETGKRYSENDENLLLNDKNVTGLEKNKINESLNANSNNNQNIDLVLKGHHFQKTEEALPSYISKDVSEQIENKLLHMAEKGVKQLTLELNPAHLGRVEVRMEMEKDQLNIQMKVESEEVRKVVEAQMTRLKESLELQNVHLAKTEVNVFIGDKSFMSNSNQNKDKRSPKNKNSFNRNNNAIDDVFVEKKEIRKYGYNTVEYTA